MGASSGGKNPPPSFQNTISAAPFGSFDFGASTSNSFLGGGNPNSGIAPRHSATFTFTLTGINLNELTALSFVNELTTSNQFFLARYRGFDNGLSDKVPGFDPPPVNNNAPIPSTLLLFGSALAGLAVRRFRKA